MCVLTFRLKVTTSIVKSYDLLAMNDWAATLPCFGAYCITDLEVLWLNRNNPILSADQTDEALFSLPSYPSS
jgi:hypothetical protein